MNKTKQKQDDNAIDNVPDGESEQFKMLQLMEKKAQKLIIKPAEKKNAPPIIKKELNLMLFSISLEYDDKNEKLHPVLRIFSVKLKRFIEIIHLDNNIFENYNNDILYKDRIARIVKGYIMAN